MAIEPSADLRKQYDALVNGVGTCPSNTSQIEVSGNDRTTFLQGFCTNDIKQLQPGKGCEAFFTNVQGKILAHAFVFCGEHSLIIDTVGGQSGPLVKHLDRYLITEDVQLCDRSMDWSEIIVGGKDSPHFLATALDAEPPSNLLDHCEAELAGCSVFVRKAPIIGEPSFLISFENASARDVIGQLGKQSPVATACTDEAADICRIEAGFPLFGQDITEKNLPQEVCRDQLAISLTKGCYLGQETVARIDAMGHVNWNLVGVKFTSSTLPESGTELKLADKVVGHVTSSAYSFRLSAPLALAYIRRLHSAAGTELTSTLGRAEVVELPV